MGALAVFFYLALAGVLLYTLSILIGLQKEVRRIADSLDRRDEKPSRPEI